MAQILDKLKKRFVKKIIGRYIPKSHLKVYYFIIISFYTFSSFSFSFILLKFHSVYKYSSPFSFSGFL